MKLRVLVDGAADGAANMARDRSLLDAHRPGDDPVLRIYRWDPPAVTIGYNQKFADFDEDAVRAAGYDVVRRPTGGRAILHARELTYAVVGASPGPVFGDSLHDVYMTINRALVAFLQGLGVAATISDGESREDARGLVCFKSAGRYEIAVEGRKIIGSAQRRTAGCFLQHGSILAGPEHLDLLRFLRPGGPGPEVPRAVLAAGTTDLSAVLGRDLQGPDLDAFAPALAAAFAAALDLPADLA
ncbi:MAG TPA: lipoate--protein ligase family protein [Candidatus Krumholzibacteria bacterium]|nr:lipoate--protein ligase family protein [Candidatus Krumholzibacteria bacterium]